MAGVIGKVGLEFVSNIGSSLLSNKLEVSTLQAEYFRDGLTFVAKLLSSNLRVFQQIGAFAQSERTEILFCQGA